ncbi:MAG: ABC transporter substrate-binding protein [Acidimicrobiales bacterium]|jgi:ABC-type branched-subunit amino acid transport system substrate-binding protein|nr:ABC transporter substrate-binding protein [Acidimicrobiales bacterium]
MTRHRVLVAIAALGVLAVLAASCSRTGDEAADTTATTAAPAADERCEGQQLEATEVGVTADTITITVMADTGSPLAPGLFQGNIDAVEAFARNINANGGIACRRLVVATWDSKLTPEEAKNGLIVACESSLAMVGNNALFNPDVTPLTDCPDQTGAVTGLPDLAAFTADPNELCAPTMYTVQAKAEQCPIQPGVRPIQSNLNYWKFLEGLDPDQRELFMVPGDLPTTVQAAMPLIEGQRMAGIDVVETPKVSGRDEQAAFTPRVQETTTSGANAVFNSSNDVAMINMRREYDAQGARGVEIWACTQACYTETFRSQGAAMDGTYVALPFLPFEERDENAELAAFLDNVGDPDAWGAQAWQAAVLFQQTIDRIVERDGPNGITRARMLDTLASFGTFDANGWLAPKPLGGISDCGLVVQFTDGEFTRVQPTTPGTFECHPENTVTIEIDPVAAAAALD